MTVGMGTTLGMAVLALLLGVAVQVFHHYHHHHKLNLYIIVSLSQTYLFTHFRQWHSPAKACKFFFFLWFSDSCLASCSSVGYSGENFGLSIIQRDQKAVSLSLFRGGGSSNLSPNVKCEMRPTNCYPGFTKVIPVLSQVCLSKRLQSLWKS